ncbi:hypothetical protein [Xanthomarina sp. GH4-25]|uniref:hypothetical protein n=1 Tax=Xanthomarina sp. GH4-25 TaxID=3349335 RepID=UPI003877C900
MKQVIYIIGILIFLLSCQKAENSDIQLLKNTEDIISYIIESKAYALPPPPPPNDSLWKLTQEVKDSILNVKLNVAIYPTLKAPLSNNKEGLLKLDEEFQALVNNFINIKSSTNIPIVSINKKSRHRVILADTIILKKSRDWKEYDLLFYFSNISFNKNYDKAALRIGISRSSLWGSGGLFLLEKKGDNWETVKIIEKEEW